jgi:hypothetical protein
MWRTTTEPMKRREEMRTVVGPLRAERKGRDEQKQERKMRVSIVVTHHHHHC